MQPTTRNALIVAAACPPAFILLLWWAKRADKINRRKLELAVAEALAADDWTLIEDGKRLGEMPFQSHFLAEALASDRLHPMLELGSARNRTWIFGHPVWNNQRHHSIGHTAELVIELPGESRLGIRVEHRTPVQLWTDPYNKSWHYIGKNQKPQFIWGMYATEDSDESRRATEDILACDIPQEFRVIQIQGRYLTVVGYGAYNVSTYVGMWSAAPEFVARLMNRLSWLMQELPPTAS